MHAKCNSCNTYWSVSIYAQFPKDGYLCPRCRQERKKADEITSRKADSRQREKKKTNGNVKKKDCEKKEQGRKRR